MSTILLLAPGKRSMFITQAQPQSSFRGLRADYDRLSYGLAMLELNEAMLPWHEPLPDAYELLGQSLHALEAHAKPEVAFVWCQLALLRLSGFLPQFGECVQTGSAVSEAMPFLSPAAGGYVAQEHVGMLLDGFQARAEVLYGLSKTAQLAEPPPNLKLAPECLLALYPFWRHVADMPLPSLESCLNELRGRDPAEANA